MEGLIKGLLDVALGGDNNTNEERRHQEEEEDDQPYDPDQRSRSTWSQVVSGEQDDDDRRGGHNRRNNDHYYDSQNNRRRNEEWEDADSRPSRHPHKAVQEGYQRYEDQEQHDGYAGNRWGRKEESGEMPDGWETVGRKHPKQQHKVPMDHWNDYKRHPNEQEYSEDYQDPGSLEPSEEELNDLSRACNRLWELDTNRLVPGKDYQIDCGEGKKVYQKGDMAQGNLFCWVNEDVFRHPTFSRFCSLLDNYNPNEGCREVISAEERQEQTAFIEEISRTAPIKYLHKYLAARGVVSEDYHNFKRTLMSLWFDLYGRGGTSSSSSAFEHVFVGEIKQRGEEEVSGFHNWLQFYLEEAKGNVDYQGYIFPRRRGQIADSETQVLTIQFEWNGVLKSVSSTLVGVSPEFEVALYTLCFYIGREENHVELGPYPVNIKCYRFGDRIGSVFPIADC